MCTRDSSVWVKSLASLLIGTMLAVATPPLMAEVEETSEQPVFFPQPPQVPRLQFLTKYSSALDVSTKSGGFRNFVFGGADKEAQLIEKPYGLALFEGAIYVVDARGNGYGVFDLANSRSRFVRPSGAGALVKPINITIDKDGTRYVTDTEREQVLVFDADDRFIKAIGNPGQFKPVDVAINGDRLYISDVMHHQVHIIDKQSDDVLLSFGEVGSEPGHFLHPTNLAIASDGTVYVTDTNNFRVQQFDEDGKLIRVIGAQGTGYGTFARPKGITLDRDNNIYVVDAAFQNIQILAPDSSPLLAFGAGGSERWSINMPTVVKVDYDNVSYFEQYAAPNFDIQYVVLVASQFGLNKVVVFGFGELSE